MKDNHAGITERDVHALLADLEEQYPVRIRVWYRASKRIRQGVEVMYVVQAYTLQGKSMGEQYRQQHLWPSKEHKTSLGLTYRLLWQLQGVLDEAQYQRAREEQQAAPEELPPLEAYIAGRF